MKTHHNPFAILGAAALIIHFSAPHASATIYHWDNNAATAGFGAAGGTWTAPTVGQWSTSTTGVTAPGNVTTALGDDLFFGYTTTGLSAGTIAIDGTVNARILTFASGTGAITLTGGTINLGPIFAPLNAPGGTAHSGTILVTNAAGVAIESGISGAQLGFIKSAVGNVDTVVGGPLTLSGANTFTGPTINRNGVLVLSNSLALQNSSLHTSSSLAGTATAGLRTTVPSLTLGGLEGAKDLTSIFSTSTSGYDELETLTLNLSAEGSEVFTGAIADSIAGLDLVKSGTGTQILRGTNTYSGTTTVSGGVLLTGSPSALPGYGSAGKLTIQGGTLGAAVSASGWTTGQVDTLLTHATKTSGALGIDTSAGDLSQWTAFTAANLGGLGLHKLGTNTLTLNTTNTYSGNTLLSGGTLEIKNPSTGLSQALNGLVFQQYETTLRSNYNNGSGTLSTSFSSLTRATGSSGNIGVLGGINGINNQCFIAGPTGFIDPGIFFGGSEFAARNTADGYLRALAYGSDPDAEAVDTITADKHIKLTTSPPSPEGLNLLSLNLSGVQVDFTIQFGTLSLPGILKSGGGDSIISGGSVSSGAAADLVIRTDTDTDKLLISSQVTGTGALTKSGAGTLTLSSVASNYTGNTYVNGGTLECGRTTTYSGNIMIAEGAVFHHTGGAVIINGLISGGGTLVKSGTGTLTLTGANSFTGGTIINGGTISIQKIYDDGFGTGGSITFNADAEINYSSAPTQSSFITFNRGLVLNNNAIAKLSYSGNTTITGPVSGTGGIWSSNTNNSQNTLNLLSTANSFTGPIVLNGGTNIQPNTVVVNSLADSTSPIRMKSGATTTQVLTFALGTGAIEPLTLTNRPIELGITAAGGGYVISNLNTNPTITLTINSNISHAADASSTGTRALTFGGVNTGNNTFGGVISNGPGAQIITVAKTGTGTWVLSGANTHTGLTSVTGGGILTLSGNNIAATGGVTNTNSRLNIGHANALGTGTLSIGGTGPSIDNTSGSALTVATNNAQIWNGDFSFAGTHDLDLGTGAVALGGTRLVTVTAGTLTVGGAISGVAPRGIQKLGAGTMIFNASNTYEGSTSVVGGTLTLGVDDCLANLSNVLIGNGVLNVANSVNDTVGTLDVTTATAAINLGTGATLAFADSSAVDWTDGTLNLTGNFVSGSSLKFGTSDAALTDLQLAQISAAGFTGFDLNAEGFLTATQVGGNPYDQWSGNLPFDGDANGDGVENGLAWLLGAANPAANANLLLPTVSQASGNLVLTFSILNAASRASTVVQLLHSSDLGIADPWTSVTVPETTDSVSGISFTVTPDGNMNDVTATLPASEAAAGKFFSRLKAISP